MLRLCEYKARKDLQALILCKALPESTRKLRTFSGESDLHSAFAMERGKLLRAIPTFVAKATRVVALSIENIRLTPEFLKGMSSALVHTTSSMLCCASCIYDVYYLFAFFNTDIRSFSITNCQLGDSGLHALFPGIAQLKAQVIKLERCKLTDVSVPYICSIVKVVSLRFEVTSMYDESLALLNVTLGSRCCNGCYVLE